MIWDEENGLFDALGNGTEEDMDKTRWIRRPRFR